MFGLPIELTILLALCIVIVMAFEFINGFHDTANAVATVIYTNSLKPSYAVIWSGLWNFIGVNLGGIAVAIGIVNLLPLDVLVDHNIGHSLSMIFALLLTAILWNLGTWYLGIPSSSSHTLIGSIFGVGLAYMLLPETSGVALNWGKVKDAGLSLLVSPLVGFLGTMLLLLLLKRFVKNKRIFASVKTKKAPPLWIRSILILTCTGVSFAHGSNDGQKGVGLLMIILIGIVPAYFSIDRERSPYDMYNDITHIEYNLNQINPKTLDVVDNARMQVAVTNIDQLKGHLVGLTDFSAGKDKNAFELRKDILLIANQVDGIIAPRADKPALQLSKADKVSLEQSVKRLRSYTEYAPTWVMLLISMSLGVGTMVGWKRIVVTIGEKIGKTHLSYAQGACAEIIAASTIGISSGLGLPVSTTHVLSSGIVGAMVARKGAKNLKPQTIKSIAIAWLITLPVTIVTAGALFLLFWWIFG